MSRTITIEHNDKTYYGKVATIKSTMIGVEDHGILTAYLHVEGDGWGVGVGGYSLDTPIRDENDKFLRREPTAYGLDQIVQMARTVGVSTWENLPGREVIVLYDTPNSWGSIAKGIAHISDEKRVLILEDHLAEWKTREVMSA